MFKKLNLKTLLIAFGVLLVVVLVLQITNRKERNFTDRLFDTDTTKLSGFTFKHRDRPEIHVTRSGIKWIFTENGKTYNADNIAIGNILKAISDLKPDHVSGTDKSDWGKLGVTDTSSGVCRVKLEQKGKQIADFLVGKFTFEYPQSFISYVRLNGETEVYAIRNLMPMTFGMTVDQLQKKDSTVKKQ